MKAPVLGRRSLEHLGSGPLYYEGQYDYGITQDALVECAKVFLIGILLGVFQGFLSYKYK
jgi:hypothetical protein